MSDYGTCRKCQGGGAEDRLSFGIYAGHYCLRCWKASGYRDEPASAFDPSYAGERLDDDD